MENSTTTTSFPESEKLEMFLVHRIIAGLVIMITSISGVIGNSLVIIAVVVSKKLRTTTNVFVVNLAVADLLTCIFLPFLSLALFIDGDPPISESSCAIAIGMVYTCLGCSLYTLSSIAFNRLLIITRPHCSSSRLFNPKIIVAWVSIIWVLSFCIAMLPPLLGIGALGYDDGYHICGSKSSHPQTFIYETVLVLGLYPFPLLSIIFCYVWLYFHIRFHSKRMKKSSVSSYVGQSLTSPTPTNNKSESENDLSGEVFSPTSNNRFFSNFINNRKIKSSMTRADSKESNSLSTPASPSEHSTPQLSKHLLNDAPSESPRSPVPDPKERPTLGHLRKSTKARFSRRQVDITKNLFYVVCAFVLCLTPYFICFVTNCKNYWVLYAATCIFFNSCINPIVYATKHPHFKKVFKCIVRCDWKEIPEPADFLRSVSSIFK